jgi:hypothetical protein
MTSIQPEGESMRRAIRFVSEALSADPDRSLSRLLEQATLRFDLDPRQADFLIEFYRKARQTG